MAGIGDLTSLQRRRRAFSQTSGGRGEGSDGVGEAGRTRERKDIIVRSENGINYTSREHPVFQDEELVAYILRSTKPSEGYFLTSVHLRLISTQVNLDEAFYWRNLIVSVSTKSIETTPNILEDSVPSCIKCCSLKFCNITITLNNPGEEEKVMFTCCVPSTPLDSLSLPSPSETKTEAFVRIVSDLILTSWPCAPSEITGFLTKMELRKKTLLARADTAWKEKKDAEKEEEESVLSQLPLGPPTSDKDLGGSGGWERESDEFEVGVKVVEGEKALEVTKRWGIQPDFFSFLSSTEREAKKTITPPPFNGFLSPEGQMNGWISSKEISSRKGLDYIFGPISLNVRDLAFLQAEISVSENPKYDFKKDPETFFVQTLKLYLSYEHSDIYTSCIACRVGEKLKKGKSVAPRVLLTRRGIESGEEISRFYGPEYWVPRFFQSQQEWNLIYQICKISESILDAGIAFKKNNINLNKIRKRPLYKAYQEFWRNSILFRKLHPIFQKISDN